MDLKARFAIFFSTTFTLLIAAFAALIYFEVEAKLLATARSSLVSHLEHDAQHVGQPLSKPPSGHNPHAKDVYLRIWKDGVLSTDLFPQHEFPNRIEHRLKREEDGHTYELLGYYDLSTTRSYLSALGRILVGGAVLLICLTLPLGYGVAKLLLSPFSELTIATSTLSAKNLSFRFRQPKHRDEYGKLTNTINLLLHRLEKSFGQVSRFATNASHEIRTPLAVILGQTEMALRRPREVDEYKEALEKVLEHGKKLRSIVNRFLFLADLERVGQERKLQPIPVGKTLSDVVTALKHVQDAGGKSVDISLSDEGYIYQGSPEVFHSVVTNLIENALKYSQNHVSIQARNEEGLLTLHVEDDGPGIADHERDRVFEPFYVGHAAQVRSVESHGLGLSIVKACVSASNGAIQLRRSRSLGGLSVTVTLPDGALA